MPALVRVIAKSGQEVPPTLRSVWLRQGLGPRHMNVLLSLIDGPLSVSELGARLGVGLATASLLVGELSRVGLVERREDESDRRRTIVDLEPAHRAAIADYLSRRGALMRKALEPLDSRELGGLIKGLRAIVEAMEAAAADSASKRPRPEKRRA